MRGRRPHQRAVRELAPAAADELVECKALLLEARRSCARKEGDHDDPEAGGLALEAIPPKHGVHAVDVVAAHEIAAAGHDDADRGVGLGAVVGVDLDAGLGEHPGDGGATADRGDAGDRMRHQAESLGRRPELGGWHHGSAEDAASIPHDDARPEERRLTAIADCDGLSFRPGGSRVDGESAGEEVVRRGGRLRSRSSRPGEHRQQAEHKEATDPRAPQGERGATVELESVRRVSGRSALLGAAIPVQVHGADDSRARGLTKAAAARSRRCRRAAREGTSPCFWQQVLSGR